MSLYSPILSRLAADDAHLRALTSQLNDPALAQDPAALIPLAKAHGKLQRQLAPYHAYLAAQKSLDDTTALTQGDDPDLRDLAHAELPTLTAQRDAALDALISSFLAADELAVDALILEIRAGTGGDEAALFAGDLLDMYRRFVETQSGPGGEWGAGWKFETLDFSPGNVGGFRDVIVSIRGPGAYAALAFESGGHRVQRIPETETQGRRQTSAATVAVLPEPDESDITINPADVREDVSRSGGPGGQGVNKIESAVQLTHLPTNIVVRMREERSQHKNREKAWRLLRSRVFEYFDSQRRAQRANTRKSLIGTGDRNARIRTYNYPQNRCTDHRLNQNFPLTPILQGNLSPLLSALQQHAQSERLAALAQG
ncbi:MAG TPA: peptide chain release factor 1 [Phycisphaerae bacterium]|nr:peptide chain release factor 1 [Phycisphaerae bacterium]